MRTLSHCIANFRCRGKGALFLAAALSCAMTTRHVVAAPTTHTVVIEAMQFSPQVLEIRSGDTVEWINKDGFPHDAASTGKAFRSTVMVPNARWKFVARRKGRLEYTCTLHPMMKATLIVK